MTEKTTQRSTPKTNHNSTLVAQFLGKFDAGPTHSELEKRVKRIETWIAQQSIRETEKSARPQKKGRLAKLRNRRGPKTISDAELDSRRDDLVRFLEFNWPEIQPLCVPKLNRTALKKMLIAFATTANDDPIFQALVGTVDDHRAAAQRLVENFSQLQLLLGKHQNRVAGDPRQIANAVAGCPDMKFWTSLKRCQRLPIRVGIHPRAMKFYIQRKHPKLYAKLLEQPNQVELAAFWQQYRTKDRILIGFRAYDIERFCKEGITR